MTLEDCMSTNIVVHPSTPAAIACLLILWCTPSTPAAIACLLISWCTLPRLLRLHVCQYCGAPLPRLLPPCPNRCGGHFPCANTLDHNRYAASLGTATSASDQVYDTMAPLPPNRVTAISASRQPLYQNAGTAALGPVYGNAAGDGLTSQQSVGAGDPSRMPPMTVLIMCYATAHPTSWHDHARLSAYVLPSGSSTSPVPILRGSVCMSPLALGSLCGPVAGGAARAGTTQGAPACACCKDTTAMLLPRSHAPYEADKYVDVTPPAPRHATHYGLHHTHTHMCAHMHTTHNRARTRTHTNTHTCTQQPSQNVPPPRPDASTKPWDGPQEDYDTGAGDAATTADFSQWMQKPRQTDPGSGAESEEEEFGFSDFSESEEEGSQ